MDSQETVKKQIVFKQGVVSSEAMQKTIVVKVTERMQHPIYRKTVLRTKKYKAHDEKGSAHVGDTVQIVQCRPLSREKHWALEKVLKRSVL
jgi:small subunit ribosomal protein S17